jgi:hypothetical protein
MRVSITRKRDEQTLEDYWSFVVDNGAHNHPPSLSRSAHPQCRRLALTPAVKGIISSASAAGVSPRQILALVRRTLGETPLQPRDIYNALDKERYLDLQGKSRLESLVGDLTASNWSWEMKTSVAGEVTHFFFATPASIELLRDYPEVILMDCTYKTNRFGMPLLVVVGVTPLLTTFYAAFVFLRGEKQEDYEWALSRLHSVYVRQLRKPMGPTTVLTDRDLALSNALVSQWPRTTHILCIWHINKGVLTNCKKFFDTNDAWEAFFNEWSKTWQAATVEIGLAAWRDMVARYAGRYEGLIRYLETTWMPLKSKFWVSYTSRAFTLGNRATSRVEGAHAGLKSWLHSSQGDLKKVKECTELLLVAQQENYKGLLAAAAMRTPHRVQVKLFQGLIGHVTPVALQLMLEQLRLAQSERDEDRKPCTKVFLTTMGLPCSHVMRTRLASNGVLIPEDLRPFWRMRGSRHLPNDHPGPSQPLLNPTTARAHREARAGQDESRARGVTSTRRSECSFERAERAFQQKTRQQPRPRAPRRASEYQPLRVTRVASETSRSPANEAGDNARNDASQPPPPPAIVARDWASEISQDIRASQQSQVSQFMRELPSSDNSTISAISKVLAKARQTVKEVDEEARRRACSQRQQSLEAPSKEPTQSTPAPVAPAASPKVLAVSVTDLQAVTRDSDSDSIGSDHPIFRPSWAARRRARLCVTPDRQILPAPSTEVALSIGRTRGSVDELARRREAEEEKNEVGEGEEDLARQVQGELKSAARRQSSGNVSKKPRRGKAPNVNEGKKVERKWKTYAEEYNEVRRPTDIANFWKKLAAMGEERGNQQFDSMTDEEEEQNDRLEAIETRRLFATRGQAPPLWSSMPEFQGFQATRAYQRQRVSPEQQVEACETSVAPKQRVRDARSDSGKERKTRRLSRRERQPSRRMRESLEDGPMRDERSTGQPARRPEAEGLSEVVQAEPSSSRRNTRAPGEIETARTVPRSLQLRRPSTQAHEATRRITHGETTTVDTTITEITRRETRSRKRLKAGAV